MGSAHKGWKTSIEITTLYRSTLHTYYVLWYSWNLSYAWKEIDKLVRWVYLKIEFWWQLHKIYYKFTKCYKFSTYKEQSLWFINSVLRKLLNIWNIHLNLASAILVLTITCQLKNYPKSSKLLRDFSHEKQIGCLKK